MRAEIKEPRLAWEGDQEYVDRVKAMMPKNSEVIDSHVVRDWETRVERLVVIYEYEPTVQPKLIRRGASRLHRRLPPKYSRS